MTSTQQPRSPNRSLLNRGAFLVLIASIAAAVFAGPRPQQEKKTSDRGQQENHPSADNVLNGSEQIREGTALANQAGQFRLTGDRLTFFWSGGPRRLVGLENLNLQRIGKVVSQSPEPLQWTVSGIITEFQGTNYLLVTRAVLKSRVTDRTAARVPTATR